MSNPARIDVSDLMQHSDPKFKGGWYFGANGDGYWSTGDTSGWFGAIDDMPVAGRWGLRSPYPENRWPVWRSEG